MDEGSPWHVSQSDRRLLLGAAFSMGSLSTGTLLGVALTAYRITIDGPRRSAYVVSAGLYFLLAFISNATLLLELLFLNSLSRSLCNIGILISTSIDQLARVMIAYVLVTRIASTLVSWRIVALLYAAIIFRFGLGALISATTKIADSNTCLTLHQPALNMLEIISDVIIDMMLIIVVNFATNSTSDAPQKKFRKLTQIQLCALLPYHLSSILESLQVNGLIKRYLVVSSLQTVLVITILSVLVLEKINPVDASDAIKRSFLNHEEHVIATADDEKREEKATAEDNKVQFARSGSADFLCPRRAPAKPDDCFRNPFSDIYASQSSGSHGITNALRQESNKELVERRASPDCKIAAEQITSTLDHLRKTSSTGEEILIFELEEGLITPIRVPSLEDLPRPVTRHRDLSITCSSVYSEIDRGRESSQYVYSKSSMATHHKTGSLSDVLSYYSEM